MATCISSFVDVGWKIRFAETRQVFTVRAKGKRFIVCTKPLNARATVLYSIIDTKTQERGPESLVFGCGAETDDQCQEIIKRLESKQTELSYRRKIPLKIVAMYAPGEKP